MLRVLVMICSAALSQENCTPKTAIDVMVLPEQYASPAACGMKGQAYAAQTAFGEAAAQFVKVKCIPAERAPEDAQ